jgi:hypothetical protein
MTTSQPTSFLSEILEGTRIPAEKLSYFRARLKNRLHAMVLSQFLKQEKDKLLTKADLARRLGKKPEQVTRWLGAPGNWTLDTVSDLLLGMGYEPTLATANLAQGAIQPAHELWKLADFESLNVDTEALARRPAKEDRKVAELASWRSETREERPKVAELV